MANFKRHKRKTFRYPTCHGGLRCHYDVYRDFTRNTAVRHTHRDWKQPQMYDGNWRLDRQGDSLVE